MQPLRCAPLTDDRDITRIDPAPRHEPSSSPVSMSVSTPHYFGVAPPTLLVGIASGAVLLAIVLAIAGNWLPALVFSIVGLVLIALFVSAARPRNGKLDRVGRVRQRTSWLVEELSVRSRSTAELRKLGAEALLYEEQRDAKLRELGEAVHRGEARAVDRLEEEVTRLEELAAERREQMHSVARSVSKRVEDGRFSVQATMIEPPQPDSPPESD